MAEQDRAHRTSRRLALLLSMHAVAMAACLAISVHIYWLSWQMGDSHRPDDRDIYIHFDAIADINNNEVLEFDQYSSHKVKLTENNRSQILVSCTGPYVLYMEVCFRGLDGKEGHGALELQVAGRKPLPGSFQLQGKADTCSGLHSTVYLRRREEVTLHFYSPDEYLKIVNVTLGLSYLLGRKCQF